MARTLPLGSIIPEKWNALTLFLLLGIVCLAAVLRLHNIGSRTEFLGDQGRTGLVIYEWFSSGRIPLAGPTVLTGEHLGPFFYYLMAIPFTLFGFDPIVPAVFIALLGVASVYLVIRISARLFGIIPGLLVGAIWAVSPLLVRQDRILWEPNLIPFFALLYIFFLVLLWDRPRWSVWLGTGLVVGALVQLHYPNILFIPLTGLYWLMYPRFGRSGRLREFLVALLFLTSGFILILLPFLFYELSHGFADIGGVFMTFFGGQGSLPRSVIVHNMIDYSGRVMGNVFPVGPVGVLISMGIALVLAVASGNSWLIFFCIWFLVGIGAMSLYPGVVYDHYLNFLIPVPFFVAAAFIKGAARKIPVALLVALVTLVVGLQISRGAAGETNGNDIVRTKTTVLAIVRLSQGNPFAFALIGSKSFSDLHYRYFFRLTKVTPLSVTDPIARTLFLVCETGGCPSGGELRKNPVQVICYDAHCEGDYPKISLTGWGQTGEIAENGATIYVFTKK